LTDTLLRTYKQQIAGLELEPSGGGCFEVQIDDELVYSKLQTGEFPDEDEIVRQAARHVPA
jgi:selenoprotein W-related protein